MMREGEEDERATREEEQPNLEILVPVSVIDPLVFAMINAWLRLADEGSIETDERRSEPLPLSDHTVYLSKDGRTN